MSKSHEGQTSKMVLILYECILFHSFDSDTLSCVALPLPPSFCGEVYRGDLHLSSHNWGYC